MFVRFCTEHHCCLYRSGFPKSPGGAKLVPGFWVSNVAGVRMNGSVGLGDTGISGLLYMLAVISTMKVDSTSVSFDDVL